METYDDVDVLAKNSAMLETNYRDIAATNQFPRETIIARKTICSRRGQ